MLDVRRRWHGGVAARIADGFAGGPLEGEDAGPRTAGVFFGVVDGEAGADFCRGFDERNSNDHGGFEFLFTGRTHGGPAPSENVFDEVAHSGLFCFETFDRLGFAHHYYGTVVHGMAGGRGGKNNSIEERDAEAEGRAAGERLHKAAGGGTVEVKLVADADVVGGDDERQAVRDERDVADESLIKDVVDSLAVVVAAVGLARDASFLGGRKVAAGVGLVGFAHVRRLT